MLILPLPNVNTYIGQKTFVTTSFTAEFYIIQSLFVFCKWHMCSINWPSNWFHPVHDLGSMEGSVLKYRVLVLEKNICIHQPFYSPSHP